MLEILAIISLVFYAVSLLAPSPVSKCRWHTWEETARGHRCTVCGHVCETLELRRGQ